MTQQTVEDTALDTETAGTASADLGGQIPLELKFERSKIGPCRQHVIVTVARTSIDRVVKDTVAGLIGKVVVPGFRIGHVPESLIRRRFQKELNDEVKTAIVGQSLQQLSQQESVDPINEPDIDLDALDISNDSDFIFEFDIETRPEFDLPDYKGLKIDRTKVQVDDQKLAELENKFLDRHGRLAPVAGPAQLDDTVAARVEFFHNVKILNTLEDVDVRVRPIVRFQDGEVNGFDKLMIGAKEGDVREAQAVVSIEAPNLELRGETVQVKLTVLDVKRMERPTLNEEFCTRIGVESPETVRTYLRNVFQRQAEYQERQSCRGQVLNQISASADWDLPEALVGKQIENALNREMLEMQQAGFTPEEIRSKENELRQKSISMTRRNLKQHFILDRIATEEGIEPTESEIEDEIANLAHQNDEPLRRVRARMKKSGLIENLRAQLRERMAIDFILQHAKITEVPMPVADETTAAVSAAICPAPPIAEKKTREAAE